MVYKGFKKMPYIKHKFNAVRTQKNGISFPSKLEARFYDSLVLLQRAGDVVFFLRQVAFDLPGKVKYIVDFMIFYSDGRISFVDVKGKDTPLSIAKRKIVESIYPIEIDLYPKKK